MSQTGTGNERADHLPAREVVLVGGGQRAAAWGAFLERAARLRLVGRVERSPLTATSGVPCHATVAEALQAHREAVFAVALPPRSALEAAIELAEAGREAVVEAPLHAALADRPLPAGAVGVRVAHGWVTLPGRRLLDSFRQQVGSGRAEFDLAGLPEEALGDEGEILPHGLAFVRALFPDAEVKDARCQGGAELTVDLRTPKWDLALRLRPRGPRVAVRLEGRGTSLIWEWTPDRERWQSGDTSAPGERSVPSGSVRALAQLLPGAMRGDSLVEARTVALWQRQVEARLPHALAPGGRFLRQSAATAERHPNDLLARLGLVGPIPDAPAAVITEARVPLPPEPLELWAFRAGRKPVAFLTVRPEDEARTRAAFGEVACERRERKVLVGAQDRWTDRRDQGEPRVELYLSRDPALARRMAALQAEGDPTRSLTEIGELVGYPPCCVAAFAAQGDRANNTRNRYESRARTLMGAGTGQPPWPWELNNLHTVLIPFYPCSYTCEAAVDWARASFREMASVHSQLAAEMRRCLARPVLYFDHEHQIVLHGASSEGGVDYEAVSLPNGGSASLHRLESALAAANRVLLEDARLVALRDGTPVFEWRRTDPGLGWIAPFGE